MNVSSTPFIRNDYWPDYNDINQLNQRIDDVESEISLVNTHLSTDIENVSNNLNTYVNEQANTTIANNAIVNNLNANYAEGRYANFDNTFTNNAYIENLTVNKPVFDITLNTPHIENTTSLGGNFYNANLIDVNLSGDISGNLNDIGINNLLANTATIPNLFVDISAAPITSSAVLGYDEQGRVIPVHATFDPSFPEGADYLWTDSTGTARKGVKATEIGAVENLITAYGVKNAIDALNAEIVDSFNVVTNALNDIDAWQNSFENSVANSFRDVNNTFNDVNNFVNASLNNVNNKFNTVNNKFNTVNNKFNSVNMYINNAIDNIANSFNNNFANIDNNFNNADNNFAVASNNFNEIYELLSAIQSASTSNAKWWTSMSTENSAAIGLANTAYKTIRFATPADTTGINISTGAANAVFAKVSGTELVFSSNFPILNTNLGMSRVFNTSMTETFFGCHNFNQNILIPNSVTSLDITFSSCHNFNQNILIPNSVTSLVQTFSGCVNLNQNILIPNSVTSLAQTFGGAYLPPPINTITGACANLNQNILIPNSVTNMLYTFLGASNFNRSDMYIYSQNITEMRNAFFKCHINNIHIPTSVPKSTSNFMYNCLVNGITGITFPAANVFNDLPVDIRQWPPV